MREQMRALRMRVPPEFMQPRPLPWNPDPFGPGAFGPAYPPGFIGGDYDRNPDFMGRFIRESYTGQTIFKPIYRHAHWALLQYFLTLL